ncbi:Transcriptional regulator, TetR family [Corynebacterium ciconiae DSM 44920]|uniref:TetR/AcrR family transcriptional regulator n=1 Tax=Corynebacterium ciconiae TaxID=227319 RepID=UPI0003804974|nr:TetR/AcrR family transcriptional regulator [Corynebacterium ciconiae]WKD61268.1 Transcriptional regulator, TetR family [Corynebacterium ciconiae DSM 44920]
MGIDIDQAIMQAARELVLESGIRGTTMSAVARGAKISRPTLYARFSGKDAVISKLLTHELIDVTMSVQRQPATGPQLVDALLEAARMVAVHPVITTIVEEQPELLGTYFFRRLGESQIRIIATLEHMIETVQQQAPETICPRSAHALATMCCSMLQHSALSSRIFAPILRAHQPSGTWDQELRLILEGYLLP